jgi:uncharacterized membrane protein YqjE
MVDPRLGQPRDGEDAGGPARAEPTPGISELLARLAASFASTLDTRVQLAALEFAEERERTRGLLVAGVVVAIAGFLALLAVNALVVVLAWPRLGWIGLALLAAFWIVVALVAASRLSAQSRRAQRPFAATIAEFERDRAWIAERFGPRSR